MFPCHLVGAILAHAQAVPPAIAKNGQGFAGLQLQCCPMGRLARIGIRCTSLALIKVEESTLQAKNRLKSLARYLYGTLRATDDHIQDPAGHTPVRYGHGPPG